MSKEIQTPMTNGLKGSAHWLHNAANFIERESACREFSKQLRKAREPVMEKNPGVLLRGDDLPELYEILSAKDIISFSAWQSRWSNYEAHRLGLNEPMMEEMVAEVAALPKFIPHYCAESAGGETR